MLHQKHVCWVLLWPVLIIIPTWNLKKANNHLCVIKGMLLYCPVGCSCLISHRKAMANMLVSGCEFVCLFASPVIGWRLIQGVPCLSPPDIGAPADPCHPCVDKAGRENGWMDGYLSAVILLSVSRWSCSSPDRLSWAGEALNDFLTAAL